MLQLPDPDSRQHPTPRRPSSTAGFGSGLQQAVGYGEKGL
jgi:hypothetical protein